MGAVNIEQEEHRDEVQQNKAEKHTLVFVDDNEDLLNIVAESLQNEFNVITLSDPVKVFEIADEVKPNLIVIDLKMPNMNGFECLRQLKNHPDTNTIPVICTDVEDTEEQRSRIDRLGASGFISKPFDRKKLTNNINSILSNLNKEVVSPDEKMSASICYNETEKYRVISRYLNEYLNLGEKVIYLSWRRGEDCELDNLKYYIETDNLIVLEVNSSLITKFAYLQDLSPIFNDMKNLMGIESLDDYILIFDDPKNLFGYHEDERAFSISLILSRMLRTTFKKSLVFNTRFADQRKARFLLRLTKIFAGYTD